mmetsp:Transcript_537/g.1810  ORF Transcript_537/g.1810 Transcript_537/m.1810 type:complete len:249 (+) Transcript_537:406-1152(+)
MVVEVVRKLERRHVHVLEEQSPRKAYEHSGAATERTARSAKANHEAQGEPLDGDEVDPAADVRLEEDEHRDGDCRDEADAAEDPGGGHLVHLQLNIRLVFRVHLPRVKRPEAPADAGLLDEHVRGASLSEEGGREGSRAREPQHVVHVTALREELVHDAVGGPTDGLELEGEAGDAPHEALPRRGDAENDAHRGEHVAGHPRPPGGVVHIGEGGVLAWVASPILHGEAHAAEAKRDDNRAANELVHPV